jgi:hypothetical protein
VDNSHNSWNNWQQNKQTQLNNFSNNQDQRWNNLEQRQDNWQDNRSERWDYRCDRADQIRDNVRDHYNDHFDDRWWGTCGWGYGWRGYYGANPWWWWAPAAIGATASFIDALTPDPVYVDYGPGGAYYGPDSGSSQTVIVNNQPAAPQVVELAATVEQPPPPLPPAEGQKAEWMPLGVYALAQEEKGDPIMFLQLSVSREGLISGAYSNVLTSDNRPVAGQVDKATQRVAWRVGENTDNIFETSLANLTLDVAPVAIHFGKGQTQTWILVRMPEPAPAGKPATIPEINRTPPPVKTSKTK